MAKVFKEELLRVCCVMKLVLSGGLCVIVVCVDSEKFHLFFNNREEVRIT